VAALVHHVDTSHVQSQYRPVRPDQAVQGSSYQQCPECGESFSDPVALVRHVQRHRYQHSQTAKSTAECVIS
jgi:hypothetical protein